MGTATVKWISGKQFIGIDSTQHSVFLSTPDEGVGIKPSDLLLIAIASCTAVDIVEILSKKRMPLNRLEISCSGEQDQDPPWTFRKNPFALYRRWKESDGESCSPGDPTLGGEILFSGRHCPLHRSDHHRI